MRISAKSWPVKSAEQSYQKISPSIKKINKPTPVKQKARLNGLRKINHKQSRDFPKPADILSADEKDALKMLFQEDSYFSFYGHTKVHQVQPGMLLDLKG